MITVPGVGEPVSCSGPDQPVSPPFLESPFHGYTSIDSYFDHDLPDYAIDGKMILANGLTVTGAPSSYAWPAYYSPQLRQYINYDGHNGYDYGISYQPVFAAAAGKVLYAAWESTDPYYGYGQMILIAHRDGYETLYGHLSKLLVHTGQVVSAGQRIATSGTTGHSTGPHLHFSVYHNCHVIDPYGWAGSGKDPLLKFNGEQSTYLWLDGEAPDVLNPLNGWPTYASMLERNPDLNQGADSVPLAHLLLLQLPRLVNQPPSVVTSLTRAQIAQEEDALFPLLTALQTRHEISSFVARPNLAAVEVSGRAPSAELLGLTGVVAITGARPVDLTRARQGYATALMAAVPASVTPALFPSTYLDSAMIAPVTITAEENGSYVYGFAPPGSDVHLTVQRAGKTVGRADVKADSQKGQFVTVVVDKAGGNLRLEPGDTVVATAGSSESNLQVVPLTLQSSAQSRTITGVAPIGAHLTVDVSESLTGRNLSYAVTQPTRGPRLLPFEVRPSGRLAPGDPVNAALVESSGNTLFTVANVSGFQMSVAASSMAGWEPSGSRWRAEVFAGRHILAAARAKTARNGTIEMDLTQSHHLAHLLQPGEHVRLVNQRRVVWLRVPSLSATTSADGKVISGTGPKGAEVYGQVRDDATGSQRVFAIHVSKHGRFTRPLGTSFALGSSYSITLATHSGIVVSAGDASRRLVVHPNSGLIVGATAPDQLVVVSAYNHVGRQIGSSVTGITSTGSFRTFIYQNGGTALLRSGDRVTIFDGRATTSYVVPPLWARFDPDMTLEGRTQASRVSILVATGPSLPRTKSQPVRRGRFAVNLAGRGFGPDAYARVTLGSPANGAVAIDVPLIDPAQVSQKLGTAAAQLSQLLNQRLNWAE